MSLYIVVFSICLTAGILVELLQLVVHRDAELYDVVRDVAGIVAFLGFYSIIDDAGKKNTVHGKNILAIYTVVAVASTFVIVSALFPLARLSYVYYQRNQSFPVLADFKSTWFNDFISVKDAELKVVAAPEDWVYESGHFVAKVALYQAQYPGIDLEEPQSDWTGYFRLNFKIYYKNPRPLLLTIRVHDKQHNQLYNDHFNRRLTLTQGENIIQIALEEMRMAPEGRKLNMKEIAGVVLFAVNPTQSVDFYLSNIWLD